MLMKGEAGHFVAARQWALSDDQERRMILSAAIERVVILPRDPREAHPGSKGRSIHIEWREIPIPVSRPPVKIGSVGTGRALQMARDQLAEAAAKKAARSERSRRYFEEWRAHSSR